MARAVRITEWIPSTIYEPRDTRWLWWPWIPCGHLTVIAGRGGSGKGLLAVDMIATVTTGRCWPLSKERASPRRAVLVETEDDTCETLVPRLIQAGADLSKVMILNPSQFFTLPNSFFIDNNVGLVILSPLVSCLEGIANTNEELDVRGRLAELMEVFRGTETSVIGLMHLNKKENLSTVERILGSGAFANYSRSVAFTAGEPGSNAKRLIHEKYNLSMKADDLIFTPVVEFGQRNQYINVAWTVPDGGNVNVDEALQKHRGRRGSSGEVGGLTAGEWLRAFLSSKGKVAKVGVIAAGEAAGHKKKALEAAQYNSDGKIVSESPGKDNTQTTWYLKEEK